MSQTHPSYDSDPDSLPKRTRRRSSKEKTVALPASIASHTQEAQPVQQTKVFRYPEMPTNDLVWWGMSIISVAIVGETAVVAIATCNVVSMAVEAFTLWLNMTGGI